VAALQQRYAREVADPYAAILQQSDSLLLSRAQIEALQQAQRRYRQDVDSVWRDLATAFATLDDDYDVAAAVRRQERTIEDARELTRLSVRATLDGILDPVQLRLMPAGVVRLYRSEKPVTRDGRTFYGR
jgi:signal transduction histidine kinase